MDFQIGDTVRYKNTPEQTGVIERLRPLSAKVGIVVKMNDGPMFSNGQFRAYFDRAVNDLEKYTPI